MKMPLLRKVSIDALAPQKSRAVLYLFAHQDDEMLVLPKMILEAKRGSRILAIWITDGGKTADPRRREGESREAMRMIGVPESHLHFLRFPDTKAVLHIHEAYEQCLRIAEQNDVAQIVSPAYEGGNIDHDVAALIAATITAKTKSRPVHLQYPLYNRYEGRRRIGIFLPSHSEAVYLEFDDEARKLARAAMRVYRSQKWGLLLLALFADRKSLEEHGVPYRMTPQDDFLRRPAHEPCEYEKSMFHHAKFQDWQSNVRKFLSLL
jgi:LmbE family N-acetylglucosaminyl deacetylase